MRTFRTLTTLVSFGSLVFLSHANFSSIYIWGDSLSTTTSNSPSAQYYGLRESNGRTWVEVLGQRQGLGANSIGNANWSYSSNNVSYYGHYSSGLATDFKNFKVPANAASCLFVIWVDNADFVGDMLSASVGDPSNRYHGTNAANWAAAINQHLTNHFNFITNLYAKGCRTFIAPNAADITTIPQFNGSDANYRKFVRQQIVSFNTSYAAMLNQLQASPSFPGLKIYVPDIYSLLNNVLTNAAAYGLTNALDFYGNSIDAVDALNPSGLNGPGTNYVFWDYFGSPTAKMGEVIADVAQQCLSPVQLAGVTQTNGNDRLDVVNMPVGLNGVVEGSTNLAAAWTSVTNFSSTTTAQSVFVITPPLPAGFGTGGGGGGGGSGGPPFPGQTGSGSDTNSSTSTFNTQINVQFYRLRFPYAWNWP